MTGDLDVDKLEMMLGEMIRIDIPDLDDELMAGNLTFMLAGVDDGIADFRIVRKATGEEVGGVLVAEGMLPRLP